MLYANVDGVKTLAIPHTEGICPLCDSPVISRCGDIYTWHWAHRPGYIYCEGGEESEWHRIWKSIFPQEMVEIVRQKDGTKHRADVLLPNGWVLEFQNSPIKEHEVSAREVFWNRKVMWIFNLQECEDRFRFWEKQNYTTFSWIRPRSYPLFCDYRKSVWDFQEYLFAPKKVYVSKKLTGWGKEYDYNQFIERLLSWSKIENRVM